jgi:hypothetical protein
MSKTPISKTPDNLINEYITGQYALNIHHPEITNEPTGDWHGFIWDNIKELPNKNIIYAGIGHEINTFEIWGYNGIFNDKKHFEKQGFIIHTPEVYIANYYRAVLDRLFFNLKKYEEILNLYGVTEDCFDTIQQKLFIIKNINLARKHLTIKANKNLDHWIDYEINYEQYISENNFKKN